MASAARLDEPSAKEAPFGDDKDEWWKAYHTEMTANNTNGTWAEIDESDIPAGTYPLPSRLLFKLKRNGVHKCRLVAGGHRQKDGIDYSETFAPVVNLTVATVYKASEDTTRYLELVGSLLHAARFTRPGLSNAVAFATRFCPHPGTEHFEMLQLTKDVGLSLGGSHALRLRLGW